MYVKRHFWRFLVKPTSQSRSVFDQVTLCLLLNSEYLQGGRFHSVSIIVLQHLTNCENHAGTCTVEKFIPRSRPFLQSIGSFCPLEVT